MARSHGPGVIVKPKKKPIEFTNTIFSLKKNPKSMHFWLTGIIMPLSIHNHIKHYSLHYLSWSICCCCAGLGEVAKLQTSVVVVMERQWLAVTPLLLHKGSCCIMNNGLLMKKIVHCCSQCRGDGGLAVVARFESKAAHCLKTLSWTGIAMTCRRSCYEWRR